MNAPLTVTVGGMAGTGTSTLCRLLTDLLALPYVYTGGLFREEAARRGLSLAELNELSQEDPGVDRDIRTVPGNGDLGELAL